MGKIRIKFFFKKQLEQDYIINKVVKTGYLYISSPELTIKDLLKYRNLSGGINPTATVLSEIIEVVDQHKLLSIVQRSAEKSWWQRLGYFLEHIDVIEEELLTKNLLLLRKYAKSQQLNWVALSPEIPTKGAKRDSFWKIIANVTIEGDL